MAWINEKWMKVFWRKAKNGMHCTRTLQLNAPFALQWKWILLIMENGMKKTQAVAAVELNYVGNIYFSHKKVVTHTHTHCPNLGKSKITRYRKTRKESPNRTDGDNDAKEKNEIKQIWYFFHTFPMQNTHKQREGKRSNVLENMSNVRLKTFGSIQSEANTCNVHYTITLWNQLENYRYWCLIRPQTDRLL